MKKVFKLTALLLLVGALVMGCKGDAGEKYYGNWTSDVEFWDFDDSFTTRNGSTFTYELPNPLTNWGRIVASGSIASNYYSATKQKKYTGFKASATCNSANGNPGFTFCWTSRENPDYVEGGDEPKYLSKYNYMLIGGRDSILIGEIIEGERTYITGTSTNPWQKCSSLKAMPQENEFVVYTDKNGDIKVVVNGVEFTTISNPNLTVGGVGFIESLDADIQAENQTTKITYKFKEFQY